MKGLEIDLEKLAGAVQLEGHGAKSDIAARLGLKTPALRRKLTGVTGLRLEELNLLAAMLGRPTIYFLREIEMEPKRGDAAADAGSA